MDEHASTASGTDAFPAKLHVTPALTERNRMTTGFRVILAIPHLVLVGGPMAAAFWWGWNPENGAGEWAAGGGALGAVAVVCALISWFAIIATGKQPSGLWSLTSFYLRWRVKAVGYAALLTDAYPPFGEGEFPTDLRITAPVGERNRLSVAFRIVLAIPHMVIVFFLSCAWAVTTAVAWFTILFTGRYPERLYSFGVGVLGWNMRVESYLLLLHDVYPPFALYPDRQGAVGGAGTDWGHASDPRASSPKPVTG